MQPTTLEIGIGFVPHYFRDKVKNKAWIRRAHIRSESWSGKGLHTQNTPLSLQPSSARFEIQTEEKLISASFLQVEPLPKPTKNLGKAFKLLIY